MVGKAKEREGTSVRLRPADPFELIRWLARSQSDPKKAVAELVQNSLDAGARHVRIDRRRWKGSPSLVVWDDGEGVIPEMGREEALRSLAENIGHSRKAKLTPTERRERVVAGKYGVGILGFWSIGGTFEMRTRVAGSPLFALRLAEDEPGGSIVQLPLPLDAPPTFTEVVVGGVHATALRNLGGARLATYLAAELRGQLLASGVDLTIHDGMAHGIAQKRFEVRPRRFVGERLELPAEVPVEGHPQIHVELYLSRGAERAAIEVACAGTKVADDIRELSALGLDESPWVGRDLCGLVDFAGFNVPPGSRRGVAPDRAAAAFVRAMEALRPLVEHELSRLAEERQRAADRDVVRELRKALRGFVRRFPEYDLPAIETGGESAREAQAPGGEGIDEAEPETPEPELFRGGPLSSVPIAPDPITVPAGGERRVRSEARDADGRTLRDAVTFEWTVAGAGLSIDGEGSRPAVRARGAPVGAAGVVSVVARAGDRTALARANVAVVETADEPPDGQKIGIPEPELVSDPAGGWRSRFDGTRWVVNDAHDDYVALRSEPRARFRYLLSLLAKEIVHRSGGRLDDEPHLERLVEVLAHAERNLRGS